MKKFRIKQNAYENDDLQYALENNPPNEFKPEEITHIVAEVCGENDGCDWWWILKLTNNRFFLLSGGCDYTGWDCQSSIIEYGFFSSALKAAEAVPFKDTYNREIRANLLAQVKNKQPFGTYIEDYIVIDNK
jgi:hypothetical protein